MILGERALSVSELNEYVRRLLAGDVLLRGVEVTGEISGYKHHISGHRYFSLKDAGARVQCVMFRQNCMGLDFQPKDGMRVRVRASASLFPRDGSFQLYVSGMTKCGVGDLYLQFEALKEKLAKEGLFDPAIKRQLPLNPAYIGIATSLTGAAIRDMLRIARRRNPNIDIIVAPCSVQGSGAAEEIVDAIGRLNDDGRADVILAGRGGGSIEDLWAFNEEIVARAIAASNIPVISCVGHETDFTIADFVADVRAATPSMAAELAVPVIADMKKALHVSMRRVASALMQGNKLRRSEFRRLCASALFANPKEILIDARRDQLVKLEDRYISAQCDLIKDRRIRLEKASIRLSALNPKSVLERGYACITDGDHVLTSAKEAQSGMQIGIRFSDGAVSARILEKQQTEM